MQAKNTRTDNQAKKGRYEQGKDLRFSSLVKVLKAFDISLKDFFSEGFEAEGHQQKKIIFEDDFFFHNIIKAIKVVRLF